MKTRMAAQIIGCFTLCLCVGCSLNALTKAKRVEPSDRKYAVEEACHLGEKADSFCIEVLGSAEIKENLSLARTKLNVVYVVNSYCHGFYKTFLGYKSEFDSIEDLSMHVIFEEDYRDIPILKSRLLGLQYYGRHAILDENEFGRYRDPRTKNRRIMKLLAPENAEIMISPFKRIPKDGPYTPGYGFLTATLYMVFDENLNYLSASWDLSPNDVKRILNGEKPLQ